MRRIFHLGAIALLFLLFSYAYADAYKWIKVGKHQTRVVDSGDQSESAGKYRWEYYYVDAFTRGHILHSGWHLGTKEWTDEHGNPWPVKISGAGHGTIDEDFNTIPVPDSEGVTAFRYYRYTPPTIVVDGIHLEDKWPIPGDYVDATKIPGTADVMVESDIRTSMGITIHQRVLGWNQKNHDDYVIYDWTFENTGNVDLDDEAELKTQTLEDVYFLRSNNWWTGAGVTWNSSYGEYEADTLRIQYAYPQRTLKATTDNFGDTRTTGHLRRPWYIGEATLYADESAAVKTDDPSQPHMTGVATAELLWIKNEANINSPTDHDLLYQTMRLGFLPFDGTLEMEDGVYEGTHHGLRPDERGIKFVRNFPGFTWRTCSYFAVGPYTLAPGESFRLVRAILHGSISPENAWRKGLEWKAGTLDPPPGCVFGVSDNLPPQYTEFPELYAADSKSTEENNWAKDCWVATGKDSLFTNANAALWNFQQGYEVPIPPPPPSIEVTSMTDWIRVKWGTESEAASDFAGYRVYRAIPTLDSTFFTPIFECGEGTANALTNTHDDATAQRGIGYTYYVAAFDNGTENITGVYGTKEVLESGRFLNETTMPAYLTRAAGTLSTVRVVPNPFNIIARDLQFTGEPDKIIFMELPPVCDIMIYTQSGDLIRTIHHTNGSGDEPWGILSEEHSTTETGQIVVSGVYIAYIEIPEGEPNAGENTFVKFIIIR